MTRASGPAEVNRVDLTVAAEEAGSRLDRLLALRLPEFSRSRLKALILAGAVTIDGATVVDPATRVNSAARLAIDVPPPSDPAPAPEAIPLAIVHEDSDLLVLDKPAGLVVHPAAGNAEGTLVNALIAHCGDSLSGIGGVKRPGIVHRLDKDTSGLLVVAKNDRAHRKLSAQFADHGRTGALKRSYLAFVWGVPKVPSGTVDAPLARDPRAREKIAGAGERPFCSDALDAACHLRRARRPPGGEPPRMPAGDRAHPPDSGASGPYRPPVARRRALWSGLPYQGDAAATHRRGGAGGARPAGAARRHAGVRAPGKWYNCLRFRRSYRKNWQN